MTLPSNSSMTAFPENTLTSYTTLLAEYVTSPTQLECALQELTCPTTWYNLEDECIVIIEGEPADHQKSLTNLKRLQYHLNRKKKYFFKKRVDQTPIFGRLYTANYSTVAKKALRRAITVTRSHRIPPAGSSAFTAPIATPAAGAVAHFDQAGDTTRTRNLQDLSEAVLRGDITREKAEEIWELQNLQESVLRGDITKEKAEEIIRRADLERVNISDVVTEVEIEDEIENATAATAASGAIEPRERDSSTAEYYEVAVMTNPSATQGITSIALTAIKMELNLKELDEVVSTFQFQKVRKYNAFALEGSFLNDNADLISYLNKVFNRKNPNLLRELKSATNQKAVVFSYNRFTMKCTVSLPPKVAVRLPENLGQQLGFGGGIFLVGRTEGASVVDLKFKAQTLYVYSDIVKHSIVGDKRAPLLRVVAINPSKGDTQTVSFQPMIYQPVTKSSFKEISMYLRDSTGAPVPFERGAVTAVLAFRPISSLH